MFFTPQTVKMNFSLSSIFAQAPFCFWGDDLLSYIDVVLM